MKYALDCDIAVHECFASPKTLIEKQKFTAGAALGVGTQVHTSPGQFGKVMSEIKPKLAVGYHFFNDFDTAPLVYEEVRATYDGPLALAVDYIVFNVNKDGHTVRMSAVDEDIWPQPATEQKLPPDASLQIGFTDFVMGGRVNYSDIVKAYYDNINKEYNTKVPYPRGVE